MQRANLWRRTLFVLALTGMLILASCAGFITVTPEENAAVEEPKSELSTEEDTEAAVPEEEPTGQANEEVPIAIRCDSESAAPSDPEFLESIDPWEDWFAYEDEIGDFFIDHPLYEENFDAISIFEETPIPSALDLFQLEVGPQEETYQFRITTAFAETGEGESLVDLLQPGRRAAVVGLYIDIDRNGFSDFLVITTDESTDMGVVFETESLEPVADIGIEMDDIAITFEVPKDLIGDRFDWVAFTGFAPINGDVFELSLGWVFLAPVVDIFYPMDIPAMIGFTTSYSGTGQHCQVTQTTYNSCPVQGNPPQVNISGMTEQGVKLYGVICSNRGYELWCVGQSAFGKLVIEGSPLGWVARCPYKCGLNDESRWDIDTDGLVDKIFHTIKDRTCGSYSDGDNDGMLDVMEHTYLYAANEVTSCNRERDYNTLTSLNFRCNQPQAPYSTLYSVPGYIP